MFVRTMLPRPLKLIAAALAASIISACAAQADTVARPSTVAPASRTVGSPGVQRLAGGLRVPTAFAFGEGQTFVASGGSADGLQPGGVFVIGGGRARQLDGMPRSDFGLAWRDGTLYVSTWTGIQADSDWDGRQFEIRRIIYHVPRRFTGFNGLAFAPDGRLWAGVMTGNDHGPSNTPYMRDVISMTTDGTDVRVVARGIRQPWQMAFPGGSSSPFVSDLSQDSGAMNPPDFVLRVAPGQNYGFPSCNWTALGACTGDQHPFHTFSPHTNPMGLAVIGSRLYIAEYGGGQAAQVVSMPVSGGRATPVLTGFSAEIVGLGAHNGWLYVGETSGQIYRVRP
jgi:glucose/arabinose dehydrogenase